MESQAQRAWKDVRRYREGYPGQKDDDPNLSENLLFYLNIIESYPKGDLIEDMLLNWKDDFTKLEDHHAYIQWLFPIREKGLNNELHALQIHEREAMKADVECMKRLVRAYQLMLHFYGMKLVDEETGGLCE